MKKLFLFLAASLVSSFLMFAQSVTEMVYLKNGSIIKGSVIEQIPNQSIKVKTKDGSIFVYNMDEVEKITKEESTSIPFAISSLFSAEKANAPISFGVRAGVSFTTETAFGLKTEPATGVTIGVDVDIPFMKSLYFKSGLFANIFNYEEFDTKGVTLLTIPALASYRYQLTPATQLQLNAGPYATIGILGKMDDENMFSEYGGYNRFHAGIELGAGVTFKRYYFGIAYDKGLSSIYVDYTLGSKISGKWNVFKILVGYNF